MNKLMRKILLWLLSRLYRNEPLPEPTASQDWPEYLVSHYHSFAMTVKFPNERKRFSALCNKYMEVKNGSTKG